MGFTDKFPTHEGHSKILISPNILTAPCSMYHLYFWYCICKYSDGWVCHSSAISMHALR